MNSKISDAQNFLDLNGLNNIRVQSNKTDAGEKKAALKQAAQQFEAIFMQMLLKSMRSAQEVLESDSPFNSQSTKFYRDMHDQQLAVELSSNGSLGLAELIERQLGGGTEDFTPQSLFKAGAINPLAEQRSAEPLAMPKWRQNSAINISTENKASSEVQQADEFKTPADFVHAMTEPAKMVQQKLKLPFEVVIAQAALETGWGQKIIKDSQGKSSNNLFNIKADKRWQGESAHKDTLEFEQGSMIKKREPFRVYGSITDSANDYVNFLTSNPRYQQALEQVGNVEQFLHNLQSAGYATDPNYANKILGTLKTVTSIVNK